jgi:hypothetical protein
MAEHANVFPTLREKPHPEETPPATPIVSDSLFDLLDDFLDAGYSEARRERTGRSGNVLLTVVDCLGVFEMEVLFCACSDSLPKDEQLLRTCLFPASFKQIETVFSFGVLDNFLVDNLECKTTAQQYFSKLQSMTSSMFPDYVPVCPIDSRIYKAKLPGQNRYKQLLRASRQWRDLKSRMKSGLGHQSDQEMPEDGSMAIFCPACPQPGLNLPDDWKKKYSPYVHTSSPTFLITYGHTVMSSSAHLLWTVISQQSICDIGRQKKMFHYRLEWHSCPIPTFTSLIFGAVQKWLRKIYPLFLYSYI